MKIELLDLNEWADSVLLKGEKPPPGYTPIPGSAHGGYRKPKPGGGFKYWYADGLSMGRRLKDPHPDDTSPKAGFNRAVKRVTQILKMAIRDANYDKDRNKLEDAETALMNFEDATSASEMAEVFKKFAGRYAKLAMRASVLQPLWDAAKHESESGGE